MSVEFVKSDVESSPQHQRVNRVLQRQGAIPRKKSIASRLWDLLQPLARLWGLITAVVMSGAGAELLVLKFDVAPGLLAGAALVLILETMWVVALFVDLLGRRGEYTVWLRCWDFMRWSCGRARAPFYACVATALLFSNLTLLSTVAEFFGLTGKPDSRATISLFNVAWCGGMLLVLAALRAAVPFSPYATHGPHSPRAGSSLLSQHDSPLPDVFYNAANTGEDKSEEMTVLSIKTQGRSRSVTPKPPSLLEL